ncbi:MAG: flagellar basal body P-ring formation protein FlgA [Fibrobacterota bacterium]|jgi:flagella basal body P-ring formation protein FlgA
MSLLVLLLGLFATLPEPGELSRAVDSILAEAAPGARLQIDHTNLALAVPPEGAVDWTLTRRTKGLPGGTESFDLAWLGTQRALARRVLTFRVQRFETIAVACEDMPRGQMLSSDKFCPKEMPATGTGAQAMRPDSTNGFRLRRSISKGHVLQKADVEQAPLALKGQSVKLVMSVGNTHVEMAGTLAEDAMPDKPVRVKNAMGREVFGSMNEPGIVTVIPGYIDPSPTRAHK